MSINTLPKKPPPINKPSMLLRSDENEILNSIIGSRCVTLATAVVQVILAEPPSYRWVKKHCGVCCFIKDNGKRSYFIRVYDIQKKCMIWEQELYSDFIYSSPHPWFHTFETDDGQAGLNFSDENEANIFKGIVLERIRPKRDRKQAHLPVAEKIEKKKEKKKDKKKAKVTKADIGLPTNFQHVQHVGWDPAKGFDVDLDNIDSSLREFFNKAGISEKQLKDKKTAQFIYDFIDSMGGIENIKNKSVSQPMPNHHSQHGFAPPPVPIRGNMGAPPPPPSRGNMGAPPPPPARNAGISVPPSSRTGGQPPPPPPTRNLPPIPTSAVSPPSMKPPLVKSPPTVAPPNIPSSGSGPPPPPPPPPAVFALPPPPLPTGGLSAEPNPPVSSGRGALLEQIRQGTTLTPVEPAPKSSGVGRGELLDQIRQGIELKPLSETPHSRVSSGQSGELDGMAAALKKALDDRSRAIHCSDDDDDDDDEDEDDDDEWED